MIKVFGIRHHGPGSAARLKLALEAWEPDILLIELPQDMEAALSLAGGKGFEPPVALLGYDPSKPSKAAYLPFAAFSPEWQAIQFTFKESIPLRPIDLPLGKMFSLQEGGGAQMTMLPAGTHDEVLQMQHDPLSFIASLDGYEDSERWWEVYFEQGAGRDDSFDIILDMISALREGLDRPESRETLAREAHMRQQIRAALSEGFERIAVVCGSWHVPVLQDPDKFTATHDAKALRGLRKLKIASTWIPWSYDRLARSGSYKAGVVSPAWYELLFQNRDDATVQWMSKASQLLRGEGMESSPAHATEAVHLAETLASLRRRSLPGLQELEDAAISVFCRGEVQRLQLIRERLVIGDRQGKVPSKIPVVPLQRDLDRCIKSARLTRERNSGRQIRKELDLRKPSNVKASQLLHRLQVLDIHWGKPQQESENQLGSFRETWTLRWKAEFAIRVIEKGMLGNTIRQAAGRALMQSAEDEDSLAQMTFATEKALYANLPEIFDKLLLLTRNLAALNRDVERLMESLPSLVRILRYGDTRQTDTESVAQLIAEILPRINVALPAAATGREDEAACALFNKLIETHHAIGLLGTADYAKHWAQCLEQLATRKAVHPLLQGLANRFLFDREEGGRVATLGRMHLALSRGEDAMHSTHWLEGFLHGSGLLLLHHPALWQLLDDWVSGLDMEQLPHLLPLLRRAFANFSKAERSRIMALAVNGAEVSGGMTGLALNEGNAAGVGGVIGVLLGWGDGR